MPLGGLNIEKRSTAASVCVNVRKMVRSGWKKCPSESDGLPPVQWTEFEPSSTDCIDDSLFPRHYTQASYFVMILCDKWNGI